MNRVLAAAVLGLTFAGMSLMGDVAEAGIIDFNAHPTDFSDPTTDSGFTFTFNASGWGVFGPTSGACCNVNYDGTTALYADGNGSGNAQVVMSPTAGGGFTVSAFDAATYWMGATGTLDVQGIINGGGTVNDSFNLTSTFQSFVLPSTFTNLKSLVFEDLQSGDALSAPGFGIDNINQSVGSTPLPATWTMLIAGFIGLGFLAFRGSNKNAAALSAV